MKIIINTASTHKGGGVQVARSFIEECKNFDEHEYHVILGEMLSKLLDGNQFPDNFTFYTMGYRPASRLISLKSTDRDLKALEKKIDPDVVFTTSGPAYWRPEVAHLVGYNLPHFIYKESPFFDQIQYKKRLKWTLKGKALKFIFKREADGFVVQTDDVNQRLKSWLRKETVFTVPNTCSEHYYNPQNVPNKLPEKKAEEFRFLTLSSWHEHKNLKIIPRVWSVMPDRLKERVKFVLTLPDEVFQRYFGGAEREGIINIGPVKPEEGPALYKECDALFLPTLLECFSASYAEAMAMEKPILTSDLSFAHTVCDDAALYTDPLNPKEIAQKIEQLVENPALQESLIRNGITQKQKFATARVRAEEYLRICNELVNERKN